MVIGLSKIGTLLKAVPAMRGLKGAHTLPGSVVENFFENSAMSKGVKETLKTLKDPKVDIAYSIPKKAKTPYVRANIVIRDGDKAVSQGYVSITNPGTNQSVLKYRISEYGNSGTNSYAKGFIDCGKPAPNNDIATSFSRRNGRFKADIELGQAVGQHIDVHEGDLIDTLKLFETDSTDGISKILKGYANGTKTIQRGLDNMMLKFRKAARGEFPVLNEAKPVKEGRIVCAEKHITMEKPKAVKLKKMSMKMVRDLADQKNS